MTPLRAHRTMLEFMKRFSDISLKNKIFFSILAVILIISAAIAFLARWILISGLLAELELRGFAIARTIAEQSSEYVLNKNYPQLLSLIFDEAQVEERRYLVDYIFIADQENGVLSHTFTHPLPDDLRLANQIPTTAKKSVKLIAVDKQAVYDIALPINEGLYRIGTVHVGLNKGNIDNLVSKLRFTFLGFISLVIVIVFIVSHRIAKYITRPISRLTEISDELSRGNFDIELDHGSAPVGWESSDCPAYVNSDIRCSYLDGSPGSGKGLQSTTPTDMLICQQCVFYQKREGDEVAQLADSFRNMVWSIKLYRRRLYESEEKYRSLFDNGPDAVFLVDSNTLGIIDANPRAVELYGYAKSELLTRSFLELGSAPGESLGIASAKETDDLGCVFYQKVLQHKKGDTPFFVNLHACHISLKGKPIIVVAVTDITEIVEKETQLIQASKMKSLGEMSAGIAHELNQPLNAIKMGSDFLIMMTEGNLEIPKNQLQTVATEMSIQVDRAAEIIKTLRAFGRKAGLTKEKVDINKAVRGVFSIVGRQLELENITIRLELAEAISPILAHENRLQQVFFNLVVNARDAIRAQNETSSRTTGGLITIRSYESGRQVVVEIRDSGTGIQEAVRDKIFEPFFTTKEASQCMGLGLAITYGIVKDYGGDIQVLGREGEGATFVVNFPSVAC